MADSFLSRFLNNAKASYKFKDVVVYCLKHRDEISGAAINLLDLLSDVYREPEFKAEFDNARAIINHLRDMNASDVVSRFSKGGKGIAALLNVEHRPVDYALFARIVPELISSTRQELQRIGTQGPCLQSAVIFMANITKRYISIILGHYDAIMSLLKDYKPSSPEISGFIEGIRTIKTIVTDRIIRLDRRIDKVIRQTSGMQLQDHQDDQAEGAVFIPIPTREDIESLESELERDTVFRASLSSSSSSSSSSPETEVLSSSKRPISEISSSSAPVKKKRKGRK